MEINIGDIFYTSWGYDQTNIDYVKVIEISKSGKTVKAVSIGQKITRHTGYMSEMVIPDPEKITSEPVTLRIKDGNGDLYLKGSYYFCPNSKHLKPLWRYKEKVEMHQSHYA